MWKYKYAVQVSEGSALKAYLGKNSFKVDNAWRKTSAHFTLLFVKPMIVLAGLLCLILAAMKLGISPLSKAGNGLKFDLSSKEDEF